ncbi:hypothetical protein SAMN04487969_106144 [Paenibacillus algorifonticola]|uniref:Uncharacterized protein n=1 Tax=Paenibacillus algorifonticola TaxID=684063 RepID=A0A1I2D6I3_9BACL|nr:hypothetical protein SAMN04487969_106144 [Paenibacillus algorifonticola]
MSKNTTRKRLLGISQQPIGTIFHLPAYLLMHTRLFSLSLAFHRIQL